MTTKHCSILTNRGKALEAASAAGGAPVVLDGFVVGDGNGNAVTPEAGQTALVREVYRGTISRLTVSPDQENQFIAYLVLPEGVGGFTVREAGLLTTDGELYAVGSCAAIEKPVNGVTATLQFRLAVAESAQVTLNVATGDGLFLRQDRNLSDVEDKDEAVENLGLKPTVDKAKNAVQRDGDTMTGELKIRGVNALRIFNEAFGLIFRRSEECLHLIPTSEGQGENGDIGPLRPFTINLRTGEISMSHKVSVGGGSQVNGALGIGVQNALGGNSIAFGDNDTGLKQNGDGLLDVYANGQHVFRFQNGALQSNRAVNVSGRVTPSDYGNFDARYQTKTGGVQDVRLGSAIGIGRGGNAPSGHLLSGVDGGESVDWANARPVQVLINGVWRNVASL
ncbi:TPA: phage tail protein [Escherichia coli]|uniref:phage tail protein n=1 Tax=Escherichia coli TaxID=562 RepID=UPI00102DF72F|nr:phage tail protein [Escherichia coli]EJR7467099.1 phage tail protein [Escherichia coli]EJR7471823.1 phage tail protein [Escherichia coli]RZY64308.1 phage tail protein [Escherichia coli]HAI2332545.1 phage tail protein [Escherichia coli]HDX9289634.1 phage tail protein [Escherichia coli]